MIVHPENWDYIYKLPTLDEIESVMSNAIRETGCPNLCLSGGVDSSLTLHFMAQVFSSIKCFTIAGSMSHPDVYYSKIVAEEYGVEHLVCIPTKDEIETNKVDGDLDGDVAVRLLHQFIAKHTDKVISADCIDELDCGYYTHQKEPTDYTFRKLLAELRSSHLEPLNRNSGSVQVYLPYATPEVVNMFLRIPVSEKVNSSTRKHHIMHIASKYLPEDIILRRKYGLCSALEGVTNGF